MSGVLRAPPETAGSEPIGENDQEQEQEAGDDNLPDAGYFGRVEMLSEHGKALSFLPLGR
jgi:hypothetical protein